MELLLLLSLVFLSISVLASGLVILSLVRLRAGSQQLQLTAAPSGDNAFADRPGRKRARLHAEVLRGAAYSAGSSLVSLAVWWIQHH